MDKQTEKQVNKASSSSKKANGNAEEIKALLTQMNVDEKTRIGVKKTAQMLLESTPKRLWTFDELSKFFVGRSPVTVDIQLRKLINDKKLSTATIEIQGTKYFGMVSIVNNVNKKVTKVLEDACKKATKKPETKSPVKQTKSEGDETK